MPCFYLTPKQDDFDKIPELQVCIAEALYDAEAVLSNSSAFKPEEIRTLRDQIVSNLERAWEITGRSEDQLTAHPFTIRASLWPVPILWTSRGQNNLVRHLRQRYAVPRHGS